MLGGKMSETFPDELDRAAHLTEMQNEAAVEEARWKARPEQERNPDGTWPTEVCVDCGDDIEPARLEMGKIRCFRCQSNLERNRKLYVR